MLNDKFSGFYIYRNQTNQQRLMVYKSLGFFWLSAQIATACAIAFMITHNMTSKLWIIISFLALDKVLSLFRLSKRQQRQKISALQYLWEFFGVDFSVKSEEISGETQKEYIWTRYDSKIPISFIFSVIFHYSVVSQLEISYEDHLSIWWTISVIIISCWLFLVNQIILYQRLYFQRLLSLKEFIYLSITGLIYQNSYISLLGVFPEIMQKWYLPIIILILFSISFSLLIERNTKMKFFESLLFIFIGQLTGARLIEQFLYHKESNRAQKVSAIIFYNFFLCVCWMSISALVIGCGYDRIFSLLNISAIISVALTCIFVMVPNLRQIYKYFLHSPFSITISATEKGIVYLKGKLTKFTNFIQCSAKPEYIQQLLLQLIKSDLVKKTELHIKIQQNLPSTEQIQHKYSEKHTQIIESIYDSNRIAIVGLKVQVSNIRILQQILKSLQDLIEIPIVLMYIDGNTATQAMRCLSENALFCCNLSNQSNLIADHAIFKEHKEYLQATQLNIIAFDHTVMALLPINPHLVYYDLFNE